MSSRERLQAALAHREPDRVPLDMGSTQVTGISLTAYRNLRARLGLPASDPAVCDVIQQLAYPEDDVMDRLGVDVRGLFPLCSHNWNVRNRDAGGHWEYTDEWGITHAFPKENGLYYTVTRSPLADADMNPDVIASHPWPDAADPRRIEGLRAQAEAFRGQGRAVVLKGIMAGIFEMAQRIRGMEACLMDMVLDEAAMCALFDKLLELKLAFWESALPSLRDVVDVVAEGDDYGTQTSQLVSPEMVRKLFKPRLKTLIGRIKALAPGARVFFHSCGSIRELLPDFIEIGVDIINPVHITAAGMDPVSLKRDFGKDLVFWGGGIDTQGVLPSGTPRQVRDHVRRNVDALAPGGGFVFNTIHNIQPDVPPENVLAMLDALREG